MPPAVYAVPGIETNIYFDNLVLTINSANYVFDVDCPKGRNDAKRWRFIPSDKEIGSYTWELKVFNSENELVAKGSTKIIVSPSEAGKGKNISVLMIGDSLTNSTIYPAAVYDLMTKSGIALTMIGNNGGRGRKPGKIAHEGYGGWAWETFCTKWAEPKNDKDYRAKSRFLFLKNGKPELDFKAYVDKYAKGRNPDFVTIMLGTNDVFRCTEENIGAGLKKIMSFADTFIAEIQKHAPDTQIGLALTVPPASSQDAFGSNYKCSQTRWQFRRNQFKLVEVMLEKFGNGKIKNVSLIPAYAGIDCENNFPLRKEPVNSRDSQSVKRHSNGVHPAKSGYEQIADIFYSWLKYKLAEKK
ncbi:MAG: SGNH/GDSL hydrolase family protein [Victivallaceae bacterium]|nr:SGNH/GDSL hydrolase family protein [Victivallaceae bacterium]